jgi:tetratricopeptide (TPR) repeat protein
LGLVIGAIALSMGGLMAFSALEFRAGVSLMNEKRYAEAAVRFKHLLDWNPNEDGALFNLSLCHLMQEHWEEGAGGFERYLKRQPNDATALAFLGYVRYRQGRYAEADALMARAKALDPHIIEKLFGPKYDVPGPPRSARGFPHPGAGGDSSVFRAMAGTARQSREKRIVIVAVTSLGFLSGPTGGSKRHWRMAARAASPRASGPRTTRASATSPVFAIRISITTSPSIPAFFAASG